MANVVDAKQGLVTEGFRLHLNRHGYSFQCACLEAAKRSLKWLFQAMEFPVAAGHHETRVDIILKAPDSPLYLLVECKRANPSLRHWCFTRFPRVRRNREDEYLFAEWMTRESSSVRCGARPAIQSGASFYHIALEVKDNSRGDATGGHRGAIEEAASQVCRGLGGMMECLTGIGNSHLWQRKNEAILIPAIFTTAHLWGCDVDLSHETDILTGEVSKDAMKKCEPKEWVFYQYPVGPGLKPELHERLQRRQSPTDLGELLDIDYVRTIPVVTAGSIEKFLKSFALEPADFFDITTVG